jgi:YjbE family integral membrane protein
MNGLWAELVPLLQIAFIDLVLAGDNAVVVGLAVAALPPGRRRRAIMMGLGAAVVLRIAFSLIALQLLAILGLTLAGGLLLIWVSWRLYRDLRRSAGESAGDPRIDGKKTLGGAVAAILVADISMSLDNALAVAGAARDNIKVLVAGLILSVALMAVAAEWIARLIARYRWLGYVGLLVVATVAGDMIFRGTKEIIRTL